MPWHTRGMETLKDTLVEATEAVVPRPTIIRMRLRISLDMLVTLLLTLLAVGLAVAYQVLRHLPGSSPESR